MPQMTGFQKSEKKMKETKWRKEIKSTSSFSSPLFRCIIAIFSVPHSLPLPLPNHQYPEGTLKRGTISTEMTKSWCPTKRVQIMYSIEGKTCLNCFGWEHHQNLRNHEIWVPCSWSPLGDLFLWGDLEVSMSLSWTSQEILGKSFYRTKFRELNNVSNLSARRWQIHKKRSYIIRVRGISKSSG